MGNVDCWRHWDNVYKEEYKSWKDHSLKLPSSPSDIVILRHTMKSFRLKNKKGITERGEKASLYKEAKLCKVISRKLSRGSITVAVLVTAVTHCCTCSVVSERVCFFQ
ncbi:unnamed protein product, partial [Brassica rapa subsp. trilocularis]